MLIFRLNQSLQWPFQEVIATALYDFEPKEQNQLPLHYGCQVIVIGKEGDSKGWWRGKTKERVSHFNKFISFNDRNQPKKRTINQLIIQN